MRSLSIAFYFILAFGLLTTTDTDAQVHNFPVGARNIAAGGTSVITPDVWAVFNNPAMLAELEYFSVGLNHENRFLIRELGLNSIAVTLPAKPGSLGIAIRQFGSALYSETFAGLAYGRMFGERFNAGIRLDAYHTQLGENYGKRTILTFGGGASAWLNENLTVGAVLFNPFRILVSGAFSENIPTIMRTGFLYQIENDIRIMGEIEKDSRYKPTYRIGGAYQLMNIAELRVGTSLFPSTWSFGFGLLLGSFRFDIAASRHEVLGFSPNASLVWQRKKRF